MHATRRTRTCGKKELRSALLAGRSSFLRSARQTLTNIPLRYNGSISQNQNSTVLSAKASDPLIAPAHAVKRKSNPCPPEGTLAHMHGARQVARLCVAL